MRLALPGPFVPALIVVGALPMTVLAVEAAAEPVGASAPEVVGAPLLPPVPSPGGHRLQAGPLLPTTVPANALHRGGVLTDAAASEGLVNRLNEVELLKLELARIAVRESRAAGTLHVLPPDDAAVPTAEDVSAWKLQHVLTLEPRPVEDPFSGVGETIPEAPLPAGMPPVISGDFGPLPQPQPAAPPAHEVPLEEVPRD